MTKRKRISLVVIILAVMVFIYLLGVITGLTVFASVTDASSTETVIEYREVVVQPGETLWQIAAREFPGKHTGEMVWNIREINQVDPGNMQAGQTIKIPK